MVAGGAPGGLNIAWREMEARRAAAETQRRAEQFIANQTLFCLHQPVSQSGETTEEWELCVRGAPSDIRDLNMAELAFVTRTTVRAEAGFTEEVKRDVKTGPLWWLHEKQGDVLSGIFRFYGLDFDSILKEKHSAEGEILRGIAEMEDWVRGRKKVQHPNDTPEHNARNELAGLTNSLTKDNGNAAQQGGLLLFDYLTSGEGRGVDHPYAPLKSRALLALAQIDPVRAAPIVEAKEESREGVFDTLEGIQTLGLLKTDWAYQKLLQFLEDAKASNRASAIDALKNFSIDQRIAVLTGKPEIGVLDSDDYVRSLACQALDEGSKSVQELTKPGQCAHDREYYPRSHSIGALARIGTVEAVDALLHLEPKDRPELRNIEEAIDRADPDGSKRRTLEGPAWTGCSTTGIGGL